jgi:hypothetical protein
MRESSAPIMRARNPEANWVFLSFDALRFLYRHENGGYCKEIRGRCRANKCPKILK